MVIDKLIPKKDRLEFPRFMDFHESKTYRQSANTRVFNVKYEYWYDERLFLIGKFEEEHYLCMLEPETFSLAVASSDFLKEPTVGQVIALFRDKLKRSRLTIHEVIRNFKARNLDIELWEINSLLL